MQRKREDRNSLLRLVLLCMLLCTRNDGKITAWAPYKMLYHWNGWFLTEDVGEAKAQTKNEVGPGHFGTPILGKSKCRLRH